MPCAKSMSRCATATLVLVAALFQVQPALAKSSREPGPPDHAVAGPHAPKPSDQTLVETEYGLLQGYVNDAGALVWRGVPYASPPIGDLRWKAPQDPEPWTGVFDATEPASECTQLLTGRDWIRQPVAVGSEDCLYLDVYRPPTDEVHLPVYVWIHGGSNNFGSAKSYDGTAIALRSNVVVVILQYRLGALGWLYHPALQTGDPLTDSGDFGTLDHTQALRWIHENISAFGGDPGNVTIAGESAGAHDVMNQVVTPLAAGLFHRAMSESGGMTTKPPAYAEMMANQHVDALLVYDGTAADLAQAAAIRASWTDEQIADYLRAKPAGDFFLAYLQAFGSLPTYDGVEDGYVIPEGGWIPAIRAGTYNRVPIILGSNEYETKSFMPLYGGFIKVAYGVPSGPYTWFQLIGVLKGETKPDGTPLTLADVLPSQLDLDVYEVAGYFGARNWRAKFVDSVARELSAVQDDVYAYLFKWGGIGSGPHPFDFIYAAGHGMEIPFFFGWDEDLFGYSFVPENEAGRKALQRVMMTYLAQFARTGNPNRPVSRLRVWKPWSNKAGKPKIIVFDADYRKAIVKMSKEEVTFEGVTAGLDAATADFPSNYRAAAYFFQWSQPW